MDSRKLLFSSDQPLDKVVGIQTGSGTMGSFGGIDELFPHNMGFTPLAMVKWSTTPDFSVSYDMSSALTPTDVALTARCNGINLHISAYNFLPSSVTVYWRVLYLMPTDVDAPAGFTQTLLDKFNINSDYNYSKLYGAGIATSGSISHDLGYFPQCEVWSEIDGWTKQITDFIPDNPRVSISTSTVSFLPGLFVTPNRWHYRIYVDGLS